MTITINGIPSKDIPGYKGAAKELGVDAIVDAPNGEYATMHFIVNDLYEILVIGKVAGINQAYNTFKGPLGEMIMGLEQNINKYLKNNENNDNKL